MTAWRDAAVERRSPRREGGLQGHEGERTVVQEWVCRDRDRDGTCVIVEEFPSAGAAQVNDDLPATSRIAEGMARLADGPPTFRNLDLLRHD